MKNDMWNEIKDECVSVSDTIDVIYLINKNVFRDSNNNNK